MKQLVKHKIDGKWFTVGNISQGQYGPRLGLKVTKELRDLVNNAAPDSWVNFSVYDEKPREEPEQAPPARVLEDDSIPF